MVGNELKYKLFTKGYYCINYDYDLTDLVLNGIYNLDEIESDIEVMYLDDTAKQNILSQFTDAIENITHIIGECDVANIHISRKCHYKSLSFHTDFYDQKSDFFLLFYPIEWDNNNGGQIVFGIENEHGDTAYCDAFCITTELVLFINNSNPLFKHCVFPSMDDVNRYLGCIELRRVRK